MGCCFAKEEDRPDSTDIEIENSTRFNCKEFVNLDCGCKVKVKTRDKGCEYISFVFIL